ncbi:MAG: hypothetical protein HYV67_03865 [Candidatus Taylorbacteria bacterium]|nr:hypothetical protein [Candidatus Taylorbacteria bacterium]
MVCAAGGCACGPYSGSGYYPTYGPYEYVYPSYGYRYHSYYPSYGGHHNHSGHHHGGGHHGGHR